MRRPLSIMRANPEQGWLDFLYKPVGRGLEVFGQRVPGDSVSVLGPIGNGFTPDPARPQIVAIGGGVGIPPMVFLAECLRDDPRFQVLVLMGSEVPFPFRLTEGKIEGPRHTGAGLGAVSRCWNPGASRHGWPAMKIMTAASPDSSRTWRGCGWKRCPAGNWSEVQIFGCGPTGMLAATAGSRKALRPAVSTGSGGVHGLRGRRVRGLYRAAQHAGRSRHEAGLCRRTGIRRPPGLPRSDRAACGSGPDHRPRCLRCNEALLLSDSPKFCSKVHIPWSPSRLYGRIHLRDLVGTDNRLAAGINRRDW